MSKLPQPSSFDSTRTVLERLFGGGIDPTAHALSSDIGREPASNTAVIFAAITQARAIDRLNATIKEALAEQRAERDARRDGERKRERAAQPAVKPL